MLPSPYTKKLTEIMDEINKQQVQLADFQRNYEWKEKKVIDLFDSLRRNRFASSLLFWEVDPNKQYIHSLPFSSFEDSEVKDLIPGNLVLDGQQRLTSIYNFLYNRAKKTYYIHMKELYQDLKKQDEFKNIDMEQYFLDKEENEMVSFFENADLMLKNHVKRKNKEQKPQIVNDLLPFTALKNRTSLDKELASYIDREKDNGGEKEYIYFLKSLLPIIFDSLFNYQFIVISFSKAATLQEVTETFENINNTGVKLSPFDICVAKIMRSDINIKTKMDEIITSPRTKEMVEILTKDKTNLLLVLALLADLEPKKGKLPELLEKTHIENFWDEAKNNLSLSVNLIGKEFGAGIDKTANYIPYLTTVIVVAGVLGKIGYASMTKDKQGDMKKKLKEWYYSVSFSELYARSTDGRLKKDVKELTAWLNGGIKPDYLEKVISLPEISNISAKSREGKTILNLLNSKKPKDFFDATIPSGIGLNIESSDLHHIFPKDMYKGKHNVKELDCVFNTTFILSSTNQSIKKDGTDVYVKRIENKVGPNLEKVMQEHFINKDMIEMLKEERFDDFIKERAKLIKEEFLGMGIKIEFGNQPEEEEIEEEEEEVTEGE